MVFRPIFDAEYEEGLALGRRRLESAAIADFVRYEPSTDRVILGLSGCEISIPRGGIHEFAGLSPEAFAGLRLSAIGDAIALNGHDVHVDLAGLLADLMPIPAVNHAIAKRGGAASSAAKAEAARRNGAKGGRPRKTGIGSTG